jgi:hypothetical protein
MTEENATVKNTFEEAVKANLHGEAPNQLADKVLKTILNQKISSSYNDINKQIAQAALIGDIDLVIELSNKLKNVKDSRKQHEKSYAEIQSKYDFSDILQAFSAEFEEMAYGVAYEVLTGTYVAVEAAKKKSTGKGATDTEKTPREVKVYTITNAEGKSVQFPIRAGRSKLDLDKEAFEFLGFKLMKDPDDKSSTLEPGTIEVEPGKHEPAARKSIAEAILSGKVEFFKGFTAVENK